MTEVRDFHCFSTAVKGHGRSYSILCTSEIQLNLVTFLYICQNYSPYESQIWQSFIHCHTVSCEWCWYRVRPHCDIIMHTCNDVISGYCSYLPVAISVMACWQGEEGTLSCWVPLSSNCQALHQHPSARQYGYV